MSRISLATLCAIVLATLGAAPASADLFEPIQLVSKGVLGVPGGLGVSQQSLYTHDPVISSNGRYLAFDGYVGGYTGVWRRDLSTGEVAPVAVGRVRPGTEGECEESHAACDAEYPSISEDGRYVSFTTAAPLDPTLDENVQPDVYVRDMQAPVAVHEMEAPAGKSCEVSSEPRACPFTLASAVNGSAHGLTYETAAGRGAVAAGRTAISANGQMVAFVTTIASNLAGPGTPFGQVATRNLQTQATELVSVEYDPSTGLPKVPATPVSTFEGTSEVGAALAPKGLFPTREPNQLESLVGASISADGTTVAWMGQNIYKQARMLPQETRALYTEPLWRRIGDGPMAPTRRVTGGSEPENPACAASEESEIPTGSGSPADPCQGPFVHEAEGIDAAGVRAQPVPQLSADGYTVAFLGTASLVSLGANFGRGEGEVSDLYVADMRGSESRTAALRPITESRSTNYAGAAPIVDMAISPDGRQLAFATQRTQFPLGSPAYITQPMAVPLMSELFEVDLEDDTLTRVTHGYAGGPSERPHKEEVSLSEPYAEHTDGALTPSFSGDGSLLAFSSSASNLVSGDGNTPTGEVRGAADGTDAFLTKRVIFAPAPVEGYVSPAPPNPMTNPEWRLGVTARSLTNGKVVLYVTVPGGGRLTAVAASQIATAKSSSRARHAGRTRARHARAAMLVTRDVATSSTLAQPGGEGLVQLTLTPSSGYRSLAARTGGLSATVTVTFDALGRPELRQGIVVAFVIRAKPTVHHAKRASRHHR